MEIEFPSMPEEDSSMEIEFPGMPEEDSSFIYKDDRMSSGLINEILTRLPLPAALVPEDSGLINQILSRLPGDGDSWLINQIVSRLPGDGDSWLIKKILSRLPADLAPQISCLQDSWLIKEILSRLPADLAPQISCLPGDEDSWLIKEILSRLPADLAPQISCLPDGDSSASEDQSPPLEESWVSEDSSATEGSPLWGEDSPDSWAALSCLPDDYPPLLLLLLPPLPCEDPPPLPQDDSPQDDSWDNNTSLLHASLWATGNRLPGEDSYLYLTPEASWMLNLVLHCLPADLAPHVSWAFNKVLTLSGDMAPEDTQVMKDILSRLPADRARRVSSLINRLLCISDPNPPAQASSIIDPLPDDLAIQILSRLPTKSLSRFLCVSKSWYSFIHGLKIPDPTMSGFFVNLGPREEAYLQFNFHPCYPKYKSRLIQACYWYRLRVIHSCNDLVLLTSASSTTAQYFVCNVVTWLYVHIDANKPDYYNFGANWHFPDASPSAEACEFHPCPVRGYLAFDPYESPHYRVVRFSLKDDCIHVQIYSSMYHGWTELSLSREYPVYLDNWVQMSAYHQGALHMITYDDQLVRFDIDQGIFQLIQLPIEKHICSREYCRRVRTCPPKKEIPCFRSCIGESRGHLFYAVNTCPRDELLIYMLDKQDNMRWQLVHKVAAQELILDCQINGFQPIAFHPASEIVYLATGRGILSYDPSKSRPVERCKICTPQPANYVYWTEVYPIIVYLGSNMHAEPRRFCAVD